MPSLRPSTSVGGNVSSLLRTAHSLATTAANNADAQAAFDWGGSGYTDPAWSSYSSYLNSRINNLLSSGSATDAAKAQALLGTLRSANRTYVSAGITRENMQVMIGAGSLTDKYNLLVDQFQRANANGDLTLAQSLMSQAYSTYQSIQVQNQTAADAAAANAKAGGQKAAAGFSDAADKLKADLKQFNAATAHAGPDQLNKLSAKFVADHKDQLAAVGVVLKPGMKPNYFDIVGGTVNAIVHIYSNAQDAVAPYASDGGQSFQDKAQSLVNSIPTVFGNMDINQLQQAAANPNAYHLNLDPDMGGGSSGAGGGANPQTGFRYDAKLGVVPARADTPWVVAPTNLSNRAAALGLKIIGTNSGNGIEVSSTKDTPNWILKTVPSNSTTHLFMQPNGDIQLESTAVGGAKIYTITTHNQLYARDETGYHLIGGEQGSEYKAANSPNGGRPGNPSLSMNGPHLSLSSDFAGVNKIVEQAQATQALVSAETKAAAAAMLSLPAPALPNIVLPPAPALPKINVTPTPAVKSTVPTFNPQTPSGPALQTPISVQPSASGDLQGGGSGIKLQ